jgi:hypothetical protein
MVVGRMWLWHGGLMKNERPQEGRELLSWKEDVASVPDAVWLWRREAE